MPTALAWMRSRSPLPCARMGVLMDRLAMLRRVNFHLHGVGGEAGVAKNPDADGNAGGVDRGAGEDVRTDPLAEEEDLHDGSAVDVHLAVFFSDSGDFEVHR